MVSYESSLRDERAVSYEEFLDKDKYYKEKEFLEEYGESYGITTANTLLIKDEELFEKYKTSNLIELRTQRGFSSVSQDLILDLFTDEGLYSYLLNHILDDKGIVLRMSLCQDGKIKDSINVTRASLAKSIEYLTKNLGVKIPGKVQVRMALITNVSADYSLHKNYADEIHSCLVDGELCEIESMDLYSILNKNETDFKKFINEDEIIEFDVMGEKKAYPKRVVVYMLIDFIESKRILEKYLIPEAALRRYIDLYSGNLVDYESINKNEKTNDEYTLGVSMSDLIHLDSDFEKEVTKDMNPTYSPLEKAIYIYYKLCELLSYDQEFYAANQKGEEAEKHCDINRINNVNLQNNEVVCYEFIAIYSYFLKKLGIKYTVDNAIQDEYGKGHSTISFKFAEYLIKADSTRSILRNDMTSAKINAPLMGLILTNKNVATRNKFLEIYNKVLDDIQKTKANKKRFDEAVREYREKYAKRTLSKKDKLYLLFKEIGNTKLKGIDVISVHARIYENILKNDDDVHINFISSSINAYKDYNYTPLTIISVKNGEDENIYYQIDPNNPSLVETISASEIRELFECHDYAYLGKKNQENNQDIFGGLIPGISFESREKYVR